MTNLDNVLQKINSQCISLPRDIEQRNNKILSELVNMFVTKMKVQSDLFASLFMRIFYGGSYYDDLKVGEPDEYDLDLLMKLPKQARYRLVESENHGFLFVRIENYDQLDVQFRRKLMEGEYLSADKLRRWKEGLIMNVLYTFPSENGYFQLSAGGYLLRVKMHKSGPAMTLQVENTYEKIYLNVDLVPCFEFDFDKLPGAFWRVNPIETRNKFFIVPKQPKQCTLTSEDLTILWRLSFQEQERELLRGVSKENLKPALRLLKKLRDVSGHHLIASYYIKTIFLWANEQNPPSFWNGTLSDVFLKMLKMYVQYLDNGKIPYFWNNRQNLLNVGAIQLSNITNRLKLILGGIERNRTTNPQAVCAYFGMEYNS